MVRSKHLFCVAALLVLLLPGSIVYANAGAANGDTALVIAGDGEQARIRYGLDVLEQQAQGAVDLLQVRRAPGQSVALLRQQLSGDPNILAVDAVQVAALEPPASDAAAYLSNPDSIASDSAGPYSSVCVDAHFAEPPWAGWADQTASLLTQIESAQNAVGHCGEGVVVAVIDTGVDPEHPLLQDALLPGFDLLLDSGAPASEWSSVGGSFTTIVESILRATAAGSFTTIVEQSMREIIHENSANVSGSFTTIVEMGTISVLLAQEDVAAVEDLDLPPMFGHGTMVAGLIRLVAPGAQILPIRAFDGHGMGNSIDIVRAIYLATDQGADVINMSFSMEQHSAAVAEALRYARQRGVVVVAAAGNRGTNALTYPASDSRVIGVASSDLADLIADFSNFGPNNADLAAPGVALVSAYPGGHYAAGWGTSFSTPLVAGAAALLRFGLPDDATTQRDTVENLLTGVEFVGLQGAVLTGGRLDVLGAVLESQN